MKRTLSALLVGLALVMPAALGIAPASASTAIGVVDGPPRCC